MMILAVGLVLWLVLAVTVAIVTGRAAKNADDQVRIAASHWSSEH